MVSGRINQAVHFSFKTEAGCKFVYKADLPRMRENLHDQVQSKIPHDEPHWWKAIQMWPVRPVIFSARIFGRTRQESYRLESLPEWGFIHTNLDYDTDSMTLCGSLNVTVLVSVIALARSDIAEKWVHFLQCLLMLALSLRAPYERRPRTQAHRPTRSYPSPRRIWIVSADICECEYIYKILLKSWKKWSSHRTCTRICLSSVTRAKCGIRSTLCWKVGNISGPT